MTLSNQLLRLNYHQLYYFMTVAHTGTVSEASRKLRISQPNLSAQLKLLERTLETQLFDRHGRKLLLNEIGKHVLGYADKIFHIGNELIDTIDGKAITQKPLRIGIIDVVPKLLVHRVLLGALDSSPETSIICIEGTLERLLAELAVHNLDLVLTDSQVSSQCAVRAYHHPLGESGVSFMGVAKLFGQLRKNFPNSLSVAPLLLPTHDAAIRARLDDWLATNSITPQISGEFQDSALMKIFGREGHGVFVIPTALEKEVKNEYRVALLGRVPELKERFFLISVERRLRHPAVLKIIERAHRVLDG